MRIMKTAFSLLMVLSLLPGMCLPVLADTWDLTEGSIEIGFQDDVQHVTQNSTSTPDANPVITSGGNVTNNTISVSTDAGQTAQFAVEDLKINTEQTNHAIDIQDGSSAVITVQGEGNAVDNTQNGSGSNVATIHVGENASLTIQGGAASSDGEANELLVNRENMKYAITGSAGIGSNSGETFTGEINITGDISVNASAPNYGAAIGSGNKSDFAGSVNITNGANVHVEACDSGTGIGAGNGGDFADKGKVNIRDSSVYADTYSNGAAIGAGKNGDFNGEVNIENSDVEAISGHSGKGEGAGIGAGYNGDFSGTVNITNSTVNAKATNDGAGIGAGGTDNTSPSATEFTAEGKVNIHNSKVTADTRSQGIPIGAPESIDVNSKYDGIFNGTVSITGNSQVTLIDGRNTEAGTQVLIGGADSSSSGNVEIADTAQIVYWAGTCPDKGELAEGSFITATQDEYEDIIKGAEVTIIETPKNGESVSADTFSADLFWDNVIQQIRNARKGATITVNAGARTSMPVCVLELVQECDITLVVAWNGGEDILLPPDHGITVDKNTVLLAELADLLKNKVSESRFQGYNA